MGPEAALAICRIGFDAAVMVVWGASAYLWALVPATLSAEIGGRLEPLRVAATTLALVAAAALLPCETAAVGDGWRDAFDPTVAAAVLVATGVGRAWQARMATVLLLAVGAVAPGRTRSGTTAAISGTVLATLALTGHAAMHEGWLGLAHRTCDVAHVLAAGAWLGALVPLLPILRALDDPRLRREATVALRRFSLAGHGAVLLVIVSGTANAILVLWRWPTHWSVPYEALLAAKIGIVVVMTALAIANRYLLVPRMVRRPFSAVRMLRVATAVEIVLGLAAIACVGVFGLLDPQ